MDISKIKRDIVRISSLSEIYDELRSSETNFEFKVAKEQLLKALIEAKKNLKELEAGLQNEE